MTGQSPKSGTKNKFFDDGIKDMKTTYTEICRRRLVEGGGGDVLILFGVCVGR